MNIVASYSFTLGEDETETQALVPFWDMLNHTSCVRLVKLSHDASTKRLNMIAVRDIRKGDEILNTYGELSDGELLRRYGFLPTSSRNPTIRLRYLSKSSSRRAIKSTDSKILDWSARKS